MARQFPAPAAPTTPISNPQCSILGSKTALFIWPVAVNSGGNDYVHYFVTGDSATSYASRSTVAGLAFDATEGVMSKASGTGSARFVLPDSLLTLSLSGPFTLIYLHKANTIGGINGEYFIEMFNGSGYGTGLVGTGGGGVLYTNASSSPAWTVNGPSAYPANVSTKHVVSYVHTSGSQKYFDDATLVSTGTTTTSGGASLNTATYPLKTGTAFNSSSTQVSSWIGTIIVPSALSDAEVQAIANESGYIVTAGSSLTRKLVMLANIDAVGATAVKGSVFMPSGGSNLTGTKIGDFTGQSFDASAVSGKAQLKIPVSTFGGGTLSTSDTPLCVWQGTSAAASALGNAVPIGGVSAQSCTVIDE